MRRWPSRPACVQDSFDPQRSADTVLLEVRASLRYFGGPVKLLQRLRGGDAAGPPHPRRQRAHAVGAALLARGLRRVHAGAGDAALTAGCAAEVQLLTPEPFEHWDAYRAMGLSTLADLRRHLPRSGARTPLRPGAAGRARPRLRRTAHPARCRSPCRHASFREPARTVRTRRQRRAGAACRRDAATAPAAWLAATLCFVRDFVLAMQHEPRWLAMQVPQRTLLPDGFIGTLARPVACGRCCASASARLALPARARAEPRLLRHRRRWCRAPSGELFPSAASEREGLVAGRTLQARLGVERVQTCMRCTTTAPSVPAS